MRVDRKKKEGRDVIPPGRFLSSRPTSRDPDGRFAVARLVIRHPVNKQAQASD